jgi:DNA-binding NarL/FixJ family response regulator
MNKSSKKLAAGKHKNQMFDEYEELLDMVESGMEDYEIAAELGVDEYFVSEVKRELYNDMI